VNLAGGLTFGGKSVNYSVEASWPLLLSPTVNLKLLWEPEQGQAAGAVSTPVATVTDPLGKLLGWTPSPWLSDLSRKVEVGVAAWPTKDRFPARGGLFWQVEALSWGF
jgi:hypothetical protein